MNYTTAIISVVAYFALVTFASAYTTTRCTPDYMGGVNCTSIGGGTHTTTRCTPDFMGGFNCSSY